MINCNVKKTQGENYKTNEQIKQKNVRNRSSTTNYFCRRAPWI